MFNNQMKIGNLNSCNALTGSNINNDNCNIVPIVTPIVANLYLENTL